MHRITFVGDSRADPKILRTRLAGILDVDFEPLEQALGSDPGSLTVFDIDLANELPLSKLKEWLRRKPSNAKAVFLTDKSSHLQNTRAYALGATDILHRPIDGRELLTKLWGDVASASADPSNL